MKPSPALFEASSELPVYARLPLEIVAGRGVELTAADGRSFLDFYGGHAAAILGYRHPDLLRALQTQALRLFFQTNMVELQPRREAARLLVAKAPAGLDRVFFCNSGAEANENGLRLAFRATGRSKLVALEGGFHGRTAAAAASSSGSARWYGFPNTPFAVTLVPPDDEERLARALDGETAVLILEPVQGLAGARPLSRSFMQAARRLTRASGSLLMADEVQCGLGRTGFLFACEAAGVVPDLMTLAKGLAGGFPAAALLCSEALARDLQPGDLGSTFGGGPLACALMKVVLETVSHPAFLARVGKLSVLIQESCRVGPVVGIQGAGLLLGLETSCPAAKVLDALRQRGILAGASRDPHVVRLMPPLIIDESHVAALAAALLESAP